MVWMERYGNGEHPIKNNKRKWNKLLKIMHEFVSIAYGLLEIYSLTISPSSPSSLQCYLVWFAFLYIWQLTNAFEDVISATYCIYYLIPSVWICFGCAVRLYKSLNIQNHHVLPPTTNTHNKRYKRKVCMRTQFTILMILFTILVAGSWFCIHDLKSLCRECISKINLAQTLGSIHTLLYVYIYSVIVSYV